MAWAGEHGSVVFTHDLDFGSLLALTQAVGPSVIQVRTQDVTDVRLQDVMGVLAREQFVPADRTHLAYADLEVEYAPGR